MTGISELKKRCYIKQKSFNFLYTLKIFYKRMQFFPSSQQPNYQQPPQYFPQYPSQMTPSIPPKTEVPVIPTQRFPAPFQPPMIPHYIPQVNGTPTQVPNAQEIAQYQAAQQYKLPPPQPQRPSSMQTNLNAANNERYVWSQKKEKIPWGIAESIEPDQIVRKGDLKSVLFYMEKFMNVNITKEDAKKFGTKGALNAFLILQLGVEYLFSELNKPKDEQEIIDLRNQYNEEIDKYNEELQKREYQIKKLKEQVDTLKDRMKKIKNARDERGNKKKNKRHNNVSTTITQTNTHTDQKLISGSSEESGILHIDTDVRKLKKKYDQNSIDSTSKVNQKSKKNKDKTDTSISDGEIPTAAISGKIESFLDSGNQYEESGIIDLEEEEEDISGQDDEY